MEISIMAIETTVTAVLLIIAIVLTADVIKRMRTLQEIDKLLDSAIEIHKEMMKTKSDMEAELYKLRLIKEAQTSQKQETEQFKRTVLGIFEEEKTMKKYKLFIRKYNLFKNDYEVIEKIVTTNDIYHEIGYIYCTTIEEIKRIDYQEVKE